MRYLRHLTGQGPAYAAELPDGRCVAVDGDLLGPHAVTDRTVSLGPRLAPISPTTLIGIGLNYRQHAAEGGKPVPTRPMWFMKSLGTVQHPDQPIHLPATSTKVDYEGELAVVLGRATRNATREDALSYILGYTIANDVSARDWQFEFGGGQFCHGKSFDTFCPLGPVLVTPEDLPHAGRLRLITRVNGEVRQDSSTADLVFDVPTLISFLSTSRTLPAGTVILTGTPAGVGFARTPPCWLQPGDRVEVEIEGLGVLSNPVASEPA
jgi:2-keto-4-pentenoate hydratase/2-oxohepta-3-ene-1,7-dioic acid hydratase in catechol pathway